MFFQIYSNAAFIHKKVSWAEIEKSIMWMNLNNLPGQYFQQWLYQFDQQPVEV